MKILPLSAAVLLALAGCHSNDDDDHHVHHGGQDPLVEIEPNDWVEDADYLGSIRAGDLIRVQGHIQDCCGGSPPCCSDEFDGFALYALEPVTLRITLHEDAPGADLDFAIYIPAIDAVVEAFETDAHPEVGVFHQDGLGELHVVINSWFGNSSYLLEIEVLPLAVPFATGPEEDAGAVSSRTLERFDGYVRAREREAPATVELQALEATGQDE